MALVEASALFGGPVSFAGRREIPLTNAVTSVADVNRDGFPDLIAAIPNPDSQDGSYEISLQINSGHGTFAQGPTLPLGSGFTPTVINAADFDGDGRMDFAVLAAGVQSLYVFIQRDGTFEINPIQIPESLNSTRNIAVADVNRDRLPDIEIPTDAGVIVLLNAGRGHFEVPLLIFTGSSAFVAVADLNNDRNPDLLVSAGNCCTNSPVTVLLGDGRGGFRAPISQPVLPNVGQRIAVEDFDHDGNPDLALTSTDSYDPKLLIAAGKGDGTFAAPASFGLPNSLNPTSIATGDLNRDGFTDIVVLASNGGRTELAVYFGAGKLAFTPPVIQPVENASIVALVDLNGDRYLDALVSGPPPNNYYAPSGAISVLLNNTKGAFQDGDLIDTTYAPLFMVKADFDRDGHPDLATVGGESGLTIFVNSGKVTDLFNALPSLPFFTGPLTAADFNNDGRPDLAIFNYTSGSILLGNGDGTFFLKPVSANTYAPPGAVRAADMNNDGKMDLVTPAPEVLLGAGDGTFTSQGTQTYCYAPSAFAVADLNGDKKLDVLSNCQGPLVEYMGGGDGTFPSVIQIGYYTGLQAVAAGDVNGDGVPDIVFTSYYQSNYYLPATSNVNILFGAGDGTFVNGPAIPALVGYSNSAVSIADFNGDGLPDIAVMDNYDSAYSILTGNGDGTFAAPEIYGTGTNPTCMIPGHYRSNGPNSKPDLAFCTGQGISIGLNLTH